MDRWVVQKVYELVVNSNITNFAQVKRCLDRFVENELFEDVPDPEKSQRSS